MVCTPRSLFEEVVFEKMVPNGSRLLGPGLGSLEGQGLGSLNERQTESVLAVAQKVFPHPWVLVQKKLRYGPDHVRRDER
jgi:hypothetical protein